jgi:hypothetical protein
MSNPPLNATRPCRPRHTSHASRIRCATLLASALWVATVPNAALAHPDPSVWGIAGGPVFALGTHGSSVGWELSGTAWSPLLHFALGADYLRGRSDEKHVLYLAWEPGFTWLGVAGVSLGAGLQDDEVSPYLGAWAGVALPVAPHQEWVDDTDYSRLSGLLISLAIGLRWTAGEAQFYVTPKAGYYAFPNPNS